MIAALTLALTLAAAPLLASGGDGAPRFHGLELTSPDVAASVRFYAEGLGFRVRSSYPGRGGAVVELGPLVLAIVPREAGAPAPLAPDTPTAAWGGPYPNLVVEELEAAVARAVAAGGRVQGAPGPNAIGRAQALLDPGGHPLHLMELGEAYGRHAGPPAFFNVGFHTADLDAAAERWAELGYEVETRAYLPRTLPLSSAGSAPLVLHLAEVAPVATGRVLLAVPSLAEGAAWAGERGLLPGDADRARPREMPAGRGLRLTGFAGVPAELVERSPARLAFERLRGLAGSWHGSSSQGWEARAEVRVIAAGSVVTSETSFAAHPDDTMLTTFALDGERLLLTHYCVARNQPRLVARSFAFADEGADDGAGERVPTSVDFEWLDATGIASRDEGHMDACRLRFGPDGEFSSRWSWYQQGGTSWMEEIRYRRAE